MTESFTPYWLIHERDKVHGVATIEMWGIGTPEAAVATWAKREADDIRIFGIDPSTLTARLITEPFQP